MRARPSGGWSRRGVRVHAPYATTYKWGYLHEALEIDGPNDAQLLFTPSINQDIHALFLRQIADSDPDSLHVIIQDQAGFHLGAHDPRLPGNIRLLPLPPYCPELNPVERLWAYLRSHYLANRVFDGYQHLLDAGAEAWQELTQETLRSVCACDYTTHELQL